MRIREGVVLVGLHNRGRHLKQPAKLDDAEFAGFQQFGIFGADLCRLPRHPAIEHQRRTGIACPTVARLETVAKVRPLFGDRTSTRLTSSHYCAPRMPSSA